VANRSLDKTSAKELASSSVDDFLAKVDKLPVRNNTDRPGRLIFAMDATASRAPTWDMACELQADMFKNTSAIGSLQLQLVFFRGYRECKSSKWLETSDQLLRLMNSVTCMAGRTQIERVLKHTLGELKQSPVDAVVYVGDAMEESVDALGDLAGQLKIHQTPLFMFQEGWDPITSSAFKQLATLSGGAHCQLDYNSAAELGQLLNAAAVYATGGKKALDGYAQLNGGAAKLLLQQMK